MNDWSIDKKELLLTNRLIKEGVDTKKTIENQKVKIERRKLIEDAALEIFATDGYHHASVSKIAKKAGVSKGLMYNYFDSKEHLLKELIRDVMQDAMNQFNLPFDRDLTDDDVEKFIKISFQLVLENPHRWKLFMGMFWQNHVMELMMEEMMEGAMNYAVPFITYFKAKGHENPIVLMRYFQATVDGIQMHLLMDSKNFPKEEVQQLLINQFIRR